MSLLVILGSGAQRYLLSMSSVEQSCPLSKPLQNPGGALIIIPSTHIEHD